MKNRLATIIVVMTLRLLVGTSYALALEISYLQEYDTDQYNETNPQAGDIIRSYLINNSHTFTSIIGVDITVFV